MSLIKDLAISALNIGQSAFNNSLAEKSAEKQYQRQLDFWEKQNKYNTPSAQRARVEAAGFNPISDQAAQYAGASNSQGLEDVPGNQFAQSGVLDMSELFANLESLSRMEKNGADVELLQQQVKLAMVEYILKNEEVFGIKLDNQKKHTLLKYVDKEGELTLEKLLSEIKYIESSTDVNIATETNIEEGTRLIGEQITTEGKKRELMDSEIIKNNVDSILTIITAANYTREVDARIRNLDASATEALSQADLNDSNFQRNLTENELLEIASTTSKIVGFDVRTLPKSSGVDVIRQVNKFLNGEIDVETMDNRVYEIVMNCKIAENTIVTTSSESTSRDGSSNLNILWGLGSVGASGSHGKSSSKQKMKNQPKNYR